jgi:hypothetical protein
MPLLRKLAMFKIRLKHLNLSSALPKPDEHAFGEQGPQRYRANCLARRSLRLVEKGLC